MTAYVDYAYYTGTYHGSAVSEADFPGLALKASRFIRGATHDRATADNTDVKDATCAAAEVIQQIEREHSGQTVTSESVDSWSKSYFRSESMNQSDNARILEAIEPYFYGTGLLYAGVW
ncbi:hypothetical protein [Clostridium sp. KNHs216]|uniref:hypothetical protein n=1 Tax=Clostridium sp. KNHs216 TaxID=1550235 RepID=UPI001154A217|nr:hypothetical protein [Clostridium sp. KNHs216]TQI66262.1 hypothetical protein LY85_0923 [Clostridium sp. KNHs216]